jgi:hypothetical protein
MEHLHNLLNLNILIWFLNISRSDSLTAKDCVAHNKSSLQYSQRSTDCSWPWPCCCSWGPQSSWKRNSLLYNTCSKPPQPTSCLPPHQTDEPLNHGHQTLLSTQETAFKTQDSTGPLEESPLWDDWFWIQLTLRVWALSWETSPGLDWNGQKLIICFSLLSFFSAHKLCANF